MTENVVLTDVTKRFGDVVAVENVDLEIEEGKFLTLLGPSGCGKTTTLRMIAGFETPSEGTVEIAGTDVTNQRPYDRPTGMVFQNYALFPHKTVGENVGFGLKMEGVSKDERSKRAKEMLELVELPGMEDRRIDELSGGQQQRVALARALIIEPTVLLLDEPLGALDLKLRKNMQLELKRIQEELGITFIYVTHDQEEALTMSDEIAIMNNGHLEQLGTATEIYEEPETRFVADFIGDTNLLDGVYEHNESTPVVRCEDVTIPVAPASFDDGASVSVSIRPEKIQLTSPQVTDGGHGDAAEGFVGTVEDVVYHGNVAKVHLHVGSQTIVAERQITGEIDLPEPGDERTIRWDRDQAHVVTRS